MPEWRLYQPVIAAFRERGFHVASQVTDLGGTRFELDVVAFTPELDDVRIVEVKAEASDALLAQCRDRWRYAERVSAAAARGAGRLLDADDALGVIAIGPDGVDVLREATPTDEHLEQGKANRLRRLLRGELAE